METHDQFGQPDVVKIASVCLSSGESISIAEGLTVLVGPNNAGKSQLLREIHERLTGSAQSPHYQPKVTAEVNFEKRCDADQLVKWMEGRYKLRDPGNYGHGSFLEPNFARPQGGGSGIAISNVKSIWQSAPHVGELAPFLLSYMPAGHQGGPITATSTYHVGRESPSTPIQFLFSDRGLEQAASAEMRKAFGEELVVHRYAGSQITLHVGKVLAEETPMPASVEYLREIEALPLLQEQGDGVRSFMGIVLTVITASYPIVLIDEPEAFLHPPQAYLLGQFLARQHDNGTQVLVATHSDDILRGIVSAKAAAAAVTVVRLTRSNRGNHAAQVHVEDVQSLYEDPLIKYYGILDGLFFHGVLLCEADSDCTYYRAVLESTVEVLEGGQPATAVSMHFAQCGGKSRLSNAVRALRAARVPVACAVDIDFLQDEREFIALIEACGGDLAPFVRDRNVVASAVQSRTERVDKAVAQMKISALMDARKDSYLTSGDVSKIKEIVSPASGWKIFKKAANSLLSGQAAEAFESLDAKLREIGIFLVPVGELEGFHKTIPGGNKAAWLREVLQRKAYTSSSVATQYVRDMANFIWNHQDQAAVAEGKLLGGSR